MANNEIIEATFRVINDSPPEEVQPIKGEIIIPSSLEDFETARTNMVKIIGIGEEAIKELKGLSSKSQTVDHYNALATMIKNTGEVSEKLLKLHNEIEKLSRQKDRENNDFNRNTEKESFRGSTAELQKLLTRAKTELLEGPSANV